MVGGWCHPFAFLEYGEALKPIPLLNADDFHGGLSLVNAQLAPILGLSVTERLEIVSVIWESIANEGAELPDLNGRLLKLKEEVPRWMLNLI